MNFFIQRMIRCGKLLAPVLIAAFWLGACGRDDARVYEVPKEGQPAMAQGTVPPGHPDMSMGGNMPALPPGPPPPRVTYTKPDGWTEVSPGQMRAASFSVKNEAGKQADVSVIPLPGLAGGDESNVNRWRGQVGLGSLSAEDLQKTAETVEIGGQAAKLFDLAGTGSGSGDPTRILGVIQHREGTAWFFKMTGDDELVAKEKAAFVAFLKSINFEAAPAAAGLPAGHPPIDSVPLPEGHPEISTAPASATAAVAPASSDGKPRWTVPAGWTEIPGGQFLVAKFTMGEGNSTAVNVSMSSGDGGGLLANVNRWRGQLGQSPWSEVELLKQATELALADGKATLVEMSGTDGRTGQSATVVGAVVPRGGQTWFYKLMGDAKTVEGQKAAFTQFVKEVKY